MRLFYDHLIDRSKFANLIELEGKSEREKKKLTHLVDEIIHNAVLDVILLHLDEKHHEEFLALLHKTPHRQELLVYIKQKGHPKIEEKIKKEVEILTNKILSELDTA